MSSNRKDTVREIVSTVVWFVLVFLVVLLVRRYIVEPFVVNGGSMEDTLHSGERMVMLKRNEIERFDVVVLPAPDNPRDLYIKRVIGMPGDTIEVKDDMLILNGQVMDEPYLYEQKANFEGLGPFTFDFKLEDVAGSATVPEGQVFVMGDNRRNSLDGRSFGFVNIDDLHGEADFVYWPLNNLHLLTKYSLTADGSAIVER
ncbi:signal peptidase I [Suicoccus acidiformans]|uniref:Signal peptidase I n=1 Tax=Suicoccus acidiformans TaxID=2036206 RepID=A0A347WHW9_9LACT|nr:signal peptidase I [Suicoccus acidiformans]AXY24676.1 signal peptidase I [Suicoccus acidiformans]